MNEKVESPMETKEVREETNVQKKPYTAPDFEKHLPLDNVGTTYYYYYYYYY